MRLRARSKLTFLSVLGIVVFVTTNLIGSKTNYVKVFENFNSGKPKTPYHVHIKNDAFEKLYNHAASLDTSMLQECQINNTIVYTPQLNGQNNPKSYQLFVPKWQNRPRKQSYFLSAVIRLRMYKEDKAKWTLAELKQWIHYQLWAGAEHLYICVHYLKEEERITTELDNYKQAGLVTVLDWAHIEAVPGSKDYQHQNVANQVGCYKHVKSRWGHLSEWMYAFDVDENPYTPSDVCEGFLTRYLKVPQNIDNVGVFLLPNYVLKGQGDRSRDIHYDRINRIVPKPENGNVKTLFRSNWTAQPGMHTVNLNKGKTVYPKNLKLLHYWGARSQNWGPDTQKTLQSTIEFNEIRNTIAIVVRHSLLAFGDFDAFSNSTGP